jgi:hypothetical protein
MTRVRTDRVRRAHRRSGDRGSADRGSVTLEFVGTVAYVLIGTLLVLQALAAGYALSQANTAARAAARAASLGNDPGTAAEAAVAPALRPVSVSGFGETWSATVSVPTVVRWFPVGSITRSATIPRTDP